MEKKKKWKKKYYSEKKPHKIIMAHEHQIWYLVTRLYI